MDYFQLRDRTASDREFETFLERLEAEAPDVLSRVLVNDRLALAASFPVAGVHLPESGFPPSPVRSRFPPGRLLVGRSVHSLAGAAQAAAEGADYLILGPFAPTRDAVTGPKAPLPLAVFAETAATVPIPVWAIGGLSAATVGGLRGAGVSGVAAIRGFSSPETAAALVSAMRRTLAS